MLLRIVPCHPAKHTFCRKRKAEVLSKPEADSWEDSGAEVSSSTGDEEDDIGSEYSDAGSKGSDDIEFNVEDESLTPGAGRRKVSKITPGYA